MSITTTTTLGLVFAGTTLMAAGIGQTTQARDPKIGSEIIITGCLHAGSEHDSFVLVGVTERPAVSKRTPIAPVPYAIYLLDSTDGLKALVGQMVDVEGKVAKRESKQGTITVNIQPDKVRSDTVEIETKDQDVKTKKYDGRPEPVGTSGSPSSIELARPVYKLDVKRVSAAGRIGPLGSACR
jgi:hypothetical protein